VTNVDPQTVITILRQKLADAEWENTLLQAEIIRLNAEHPSEVSADGK